MTKVIAVQQLAMKSSVGLEQWKILLIQILSVMGIQCAKVRTTCVKTITHKNRRKYNVLRLNRMDNDTSS